MSLEADYVIGEVELDPETVPWLLDRDVPFYIFFNSRKKRGCV